MNRKRYRNRDAVGKALRGGIRERGMGLLAEARFVYLPDSP